MVHKTFQKPKTSSVDNSLLQPIPFYAILTYMKLSPRKKYLLKKQRSKSRIKKLRDSRSKRRSKRKGK